MPGWNIHDRHFEAWMFQIESPGERRGPSAILQKDNLLHLLLQGGLNGFQQECGSLLIVYTWNAADRATAGNRAKLLLHGGLQRKVVCRKNLPCAARNQRC